MMVRNHPWIFAAALALVSAAGCSTRSHQPVAQLPPAPRPTVPEPPSQVPSYRLPAPPDLALIGKPKFDPVQDVIETAEAGFGRGQKAYQTGHLETAKQEFNAALATILQSPISASEDKRLQKEFDSLVDRIHSYEVEALRQGDGFAEPPYQRAPLDDLQALTFPENPKLSEQVREETPKTVSEIPLVINDQVANYLQYFTAGKGRGTLEASLERSGRFRDMIFRIFDEEKVPHELIYLAQVESGFQPRARSEKAAMGLWQFIAGTGQLYGLDRNWWVDERLNPEQATRAAARHLRDLYSQFGDWYLAMAAYDCGPLCVQRAVEKTGYADFWELSRRRVLPQETRNYVPLIIALTIIGKNPEKYGVNELQMEPAWAYDTVSVTSPIDLRLVAEMVDTNVDAIRELNPNLLRMTTPKVPQYDLRIPSSTKDTFLKRVAMIPAEKRVFWRWHAVRYGETLSSIAKQYRISVKAIAEVNNLDSSQQLTEATELVIPVGTNPTAPDGGPLGAPGERYTVASGDTLSIIARRYNVSTAQLINWNNLDSDTIRVGQRLLVAPASDLDTAISAQGASNSISGAHQIASTASPSSVRTSSSSTAKAAAGETGRLVHRVVKGESLSEIASDYDISLDDLLRNNRQLGKVLQVGDAVYIPKK